MSFVEDPNPSCHHHMGYWDHHRGNWYHRCNLLRPPQNFLWRPLPSTLQYFHCLNRNFTILDNTQTQTCLRRTCPHTARTGRSTRSRTSCKTRGLRSFSACCSQGQTSWPDSDTSAWLSCARPYHRHHPDPDQCTGSAFPCTSGGAEAWSETIMCRVKWKQSFKCQCYVTDATVLSNPQSKCKLYLPPLSSWHVFPRVRVHGKFLHRVSREGLGTSEMWVTKT